MDWMRIVVMVVTAAGPGAGTGQAQELREAGFVRWDGSPAGAGRFVALMEPEQPSAGVLVLGGLAGAAVTTGAAAVVTEIAVARRAERRARRVP